MSDVALLDDAEYERTSYDKHGRTRYYRRNPANFFDAQSAAEAKQPDFDFLNLSVEHIAETIQRRRKEKEEYKEKYLVNLTEQQHDVLNMMLEKAEKPEEKIYEFATAIKYAEQFNLPLDFAYQNLEAINRQWLGSGIAPSKGNFKAVVDSFSIGGNVLKMGHLGNALMNAEKSGNKREIAYALQDLQRLEDENASLQDSMPRGWVVNLLKSGAQALPFQAATTVPAVFANLLGSPLLGGIVSFGLSSGVTTGSEYWELRKAGVKPDLARNIAYTSGAVQGLIETSLGNVAGITGKGLGADKIASKVITRLNAKGAFGKLAKGLMFYGADLLSEGSEEALQELVSAGGKELAAVLQGEGVETDDAQTIARNVWESFKGGVAASIILGIPGAIQYTKADIKEAGNLKKAAITTPSEEVFVNEHKNSPAFEGMTESDTKEALHTIFEAQQHEREQFQNSKAKSYEEWLAPDARIEGETVRDSAGRVVYETDAEGKPIYEETEAGLQKKQKKYGKAADVVRAGEHLYLSEGYRHEKQNGRIDGEYIVGNPTEQTEYNDYGHIYYSFDKQKNTVTINEVRMQSDAYESIIKEFVRDFGEKFTGAEIVWEPKGEALQKIKAELIAENPRGEQGGLQYFSDEREEAETRAAIKLNERLKETMPNLTDVERNTAVSIFTALAHGAGMDTENYLNTYYGEEVITNTPPADMAGVAAQEGINTREIKGASEFKELSGDVKALVYVSEKADFSTFVHEAAHIARKTLQGNLLLNAEKAFDVEDGKWTRSQEEAFARGFEQYLREGKAPNAELQSVFQKAAEFLTRIYQSLKELVHLNDDIRAVYDELLTGEKSVLKEASDNIEKEERLKKAKQNTTGKHPSLENYEANRITETAADKQLDNAALKAKYLAFAKKWFQGNSYHNADTDTDIRVSRDVLDEWQSKTKSREQILSIKVLDKLLETAVETNTVKDRRDRRNIESVKYFEAGLTVDDNTYKAHLTVREVQDNTNKAYHYYLEDVALEDIVIDEIKKEAALSLLAPLNERGNQPLLRGTEAALRIDASPNGVSVPLLHGSDSTVQEKGDAVKASETKKQVVDEAYQQATEAARQKTQESIEASKAKAADLEQNAAQYEKEAIEAYKEQNPALSETEIKEKMRKEAARSRMSYEAFTQMQAQEARNLKEFGDVLFQTAERESEEARSFKESAEKYRSDLARYFDGTLKSHKTLTITKRTPAVLRILGADDVPITIQQGILHKIQTKHPTITPEILNTLPEALVDPIAVFKSDNPKTPNNKVIFTEHEIDGKPVITAIEFSAQRGGMAVNAIRSVYEKELIAKNGADVLQEWIDHNLLQYLDDTKDHPVIDDIKKDLQTYHDFGAPIAPVLDKAVSLSNNRIGENAENVKSTIIKKSDIIGDNPHAIYFQVEQEFFDEVAKSADAKAAQETIEEVITVGDPDAQTWKLFYSSAEERAKVDKTFRDAIGPELEEALQKDIKNEKIKDETFLKMASEKEALRAFLRQYNDAAQAGAIPAELTANLDGVFPSVAYAISNGHPFTEKQQRLAMDAIMRNVASYRAIFAELNGYTALRSLTDAEKAFTESFSKAATEGRVSRAERMSPEAKSQTEARSRADIDDARFLEEMADDEKLNAFLKEAAELSVFDFEQNAPADETERAHFEDIKRKQERIYREMRNFSWKGTLAKVLHGEAPSEKSIANIRGQMRNAAHSFRSLYADIMERPDLRVQDADTTDARITTRLKSRPYKTVTLENLKLEQMSNAQKEALIRALDNEDIEQRVRQGAITGEDVEYIQGLVRSKNQTIKGLEAELADAEDESRYDTKRFNDLRDRIKNERITRAVLKDTIKARDAALKAVMKRISLKTCDAEHAAGLAAVQWFLKDKVQHILTSEFEKTDLKVREACLLWKGSIEYQNRLETENKDKTTWPAVRELLKNQEPEKWSDQEKAMVLRIIPNPLDATTNVPEFRIREAYTLWKTSAEYRETLARMSGHKKGFSILRNNLEHKAIENWTADDKKLARRLIPARNKFFSLGLYAKTEQNFSDMHTSDLTPEAINEAVTKILPESLVAKLKHQPLKQWTVDELIGLAQVIEEKHREGRQKYTAKIAAKQAEAARIRDAAIKTLRGAKGYSDDNAGWSEDEKKKKGGFDALKRKLKYAAMRPYAFIEMLDGGKRGALYDMLEFEQRECYSRFKAGRDSRVEAFNSFLGKQKLTLADFEKKKTFENFYAEREQKSLTLTVQEILGAYLASFDEKSRAAVQYGNFAEQAERDMAKTSDSYGALDAFTDARYSAVLAEAERLMAADARLKATVEYLQAEYKKEGVRLREHNITVNNAVTEIRANYFPMQRLEVSGEEDARQTQKKIIGEYSTGTRHGVGKGQTKARIDIGKANQMPINLAALTTYFSSVEANERLYAYDAYAQKLNRVIKGYEAKNFRRTLENAYGSEAVRYLDKQVNTIIDPTAGRVYSDSDKLLRVIRGNTAAAYLGFKLSGIIKQGITSPAPFMQYVNPLHYAKAASDLAFHHKEMVDFIYSRSKLMQDRSFDMMQNITEELAKQAKTKAGKVLTRTQQIGMQGLEMIDKVCVAPGWLAAYREEAARLTEANKKAKTPKTDNEIDLAASRYADDVLVRTQPSGRAEELAPLFREGGEALRLLLQFQSSLNVIYNNLRHDLPNAIKNKQYKRAAGIVTGYALAGIMTGLITEGFGGGDDEPDTADKVKKTIYFAFTQGTDSVPVINGMVTSLSEKLITGKTSYRGSSSLYPAFEKAVQGTAALRDADIQKAAGRYAEAAALTLGLPTSGTKEAIKAAEQVFNGQVPSALWGRR